MSRAAALAVILLIVVLRAAAFAPLGSAESVEAAASAGRVASGLQTGGVPDSPVLWPVAGLYRSFGISDVVSALWPLVLSTTALVAIGTAGRRRGGAEAGWWALLLFAAWPPALAISSSLAPSGLYASAAVVIVAGLVSRGAPRGVTVAAAVAIGVGGLLIGNPSFLAVMAGGVVAVWIAAWAAPASRPAVRLRAAVCLAAIVAAGLVGPAAAEAPRFSGLVPLGVVAAIVAAALAALSRGRPTYRVASAVAVLCVFVGAGLCTVHLGAATSRRSSGSARLAVDTWREKAPGCSVHASDEETAAIFGYATGFHVPTPAASIEDVAAGWQASSGASARCLVAPRDTPLPASGFAAELVARTETLDVWRLPDRTLAHRQLEAELAALPRSPSASRLRSLLRAAKSAGDACLAFEAGEALARQASPLPDVDVLSWAAACVGQGEDGMDGNLLAASGWTRDPAWAIQLARMEPASQRWAFQYAVGDDWRSMVQAASLDAAAVYVLEATIGGTATADLLAVELSDGRNLAAVRSHRLGEPKLFRVAFRAPAAGGTAAVFPVLFRGPGEASIAGVRLGGVRNRPGRLQ